MDASDAALDVLLIRQALALFNPILKGVPGMHPISAFLNYYEPPSYIGYWQRITNLSKVQFPVGISPETRYMEVISFHYGRTFVRHKRNDGTGIEGEYMLVVTENGELLEQYIRTRTQDVHVCVDGEEPKRLRTYITLRGSFRHVDDASLQTMLEQSDYTFADTLLKELLGAHARSENKKNHWSRKILALLPRLDLENLINEAERNNRIVGAKWFKDLTTGGKVTTT